MEEIETLYRYEIQKERIVSKIRMEPALFS